MADKFDWYQIKFLESTANLKQILSRNLGKRISTSLANAITICLQQGRSFFESAERSPLEIKPLLVFYGMVGFAKALIIARTLKGLETLPQTHGLSDVSNRKATLETLELKVENQGTFQSINDSVRTVEKIHIMDESTRIEKMTKPTCKSEELNQRTISLKQILARIPGLSNLYGDTFDEEAKAVQCNHFYRDDHNEWITIDVFHNKLFKDRSELKEIVTKLRKRFPFLSNWCLVSAYRSSMTFSNMDKTNIDEFSEEFLSKHPGGDGFDVGVNPNKNGTHQEDIICKVDPICGNIRSSGYFIIESFEGLYLSELTLYYLGMFILSSLVRYRPNIWANSISRRFFSTSPVDDKALALIERFLNLSLTELPEMIVNSIKEPFD